MVSTITIAVQYPEMPSEMDIVFFNLPLGLSKEFFLDKLRLALKTIERDENEDRFTYTDRIFDTVARSCHAQWNYLNVDAEIEIN